jgi:hypothetical protein
MESSHNKHPPVRGVRYVCLSVDRLDFFKLSVKFGQFK